MKRRLFVWIAVLLPLGMMAQDDIYFVPSRKAKTEKMEKTENSGKEVPAVTTTTVYTEPAETVVVVRNRDGELRDVDEYNRRYDQFFRNNKGFGAVLSLQNEMKMLHNYL